MIENVSPEERLLNLIKKNEPVPKNVQDKTPKEKETKEPEKKEPVKKAATGLQIKKKVKKPSAFSIVNRLLVIVILCAFLFMGFNYLNPFKPKVNVLERSAAGAGDEELKSGPEEMPSFSHYVDILSRRQLFKFYEAPKPKPLEPAKPKVTLQQLLGGYTFVGVLFGDVPQAIVEEKRSGQSFYLTEGQYLGEIKIEKIQRGKVTVSYGDEKIDILI